MTGADYSLPPATTRRELRERERAHGSVAVIREPEGAPVTPIPRVPRPPRRTIGSRLLSFTALIAVGAFLVGVSLPAVALGGNAPYGVDETAPLAAALEARGQILDVTGEPVEDMGTRDGFEVKSWAQVLRDEYGPGNYSYSVGSGTGAIRWPFPYFVPISSGYGPRPSPCRGCSTMHLAIDLTPGAGAPIYAIADGVVTRREPRGASWGNNLTIEHHIDGHVVTSSYAHMQWDSSPIELGDTIKVGDFLGLVGATGEATGAHLHLEMTVDGEHVNPLEWLTAHTG